MLRRDHDSPAHECSSFHVICALLRNRPSTPLTEDGDGAWSGMDGTSDGMLTSGYNTPDVSRPGTPEDVPNIPLGERDGLPLPSSKRGRSFTKEAAKLVALHKAKTMFKSKGKKREVESKVSASTSSKSAPQDPRARSAPLLSAGGAVYDDEVRPGSHKSAPGGGVLSALLKLYEQPQSERSSQATLVPSAASTPPETAASATGFFQNAGRHGGPEKLPSSLAFADEVQRWNDLQLNSMLNSGSNHADTERTAQPQPYKPKTQNGILSALQQSTAAMTGAASPISSSAAQSIRGLADNAK